MDQQLESYKCWSYKKVFLYNMVKEMWEELTLLLQRVLYRKRVLKKRCLKGISHPHN